jgi:hypothetical protein
MAAPSAQTKPIRAGVYSSIESAQTAVDQLQEAGFSRDQITVVCSDRTKERFFREFEHEHPAGTDVVDAAATGSLAGMILGGLTTAGVATAAGVSVLFAGPSFLLGGAIAGGLIGAMTTRGEEGELADFYDQSVTQGKLLVAVQDKDPARLVRAEQIIKGAGAEPLPLVKG